MNCGYDALCGEAQLCEGAALVLQSKGISISPVIYYLLESDLLFLIGITQQQQQQQQGRAVQGAGRRVGVRGVGGGGGRVLKHMLQHTLGGWSGLSCKACTRISCN